MGKIKNNIIYIFFALFPVIDILTSFSIRYNISSVSIGIVVRGFFLLCCFIYTVLKNSDRKKIIIYYILLTIVTTIFFFIRIDSFSTISLINEAKTLLKFCYFPIILIFFNTYDINKEKLNIAVKFNSLIYILGIIIPLITNTAFNSYNEYNELYNGVIGWFYSANEIGAILAANLILLYLSLSNESNNTLTTILIILNVFTLTLIGTKVALFSIVIITVAIFLVQLIKREKGESFKDSKILKLSLMLLIISVGLILFSSTSYNIFRRFNLNKPDDTEYNSFISKLLSGRDIQLLNTYSNYKSKNIVHKLFGLGFTNGMNKLRSIEMDVFDIFFGYGIIGFIVYFTPLIYFIIKFKQEKKLFTSYNIICIIGIILLFLISTLSGHTLSAPAVSIYLALLINLVIKK